MDEIVPLNSPEIRSLLDHVPVAKYLNVHVREKLAFHLNQRLIRETISLPHIYRDYRGLAQLMGLEELINAISLSDPTKELLCAWQSHRSNSIGKLLIFLEQMERYDIIDDVTPLLDQSVPELRVLFGYSSEEPRADYWKLTMIDRGSWGALAPTAVVPYSVNSLKMVIIFQTGLKLEDEAETIRKLQAENMKRTGYDLQYNFVVGEDSVIYEGTGWNNESSNTHRYKKVSFSIAIIGDFFRSDPSNQIMDSTKALIQYGISLGKIHGKHYSVHTEFDNIIPHKRRELNRMKEIVRHWPRYVETTLADI